MNPQPFDLREALPPGVTVLEASAGTGKTYTIAALATRLIADGAAVEQLLLVSFTRIATGELRERVRERLVAAEHELRRVLAGAPPPREDTLDAVLADGPREAVELRCDRLAAAIAEFDAATISTTHGFCQDVLAELGTLGDLEPDVTFVADASDLTKEVVDDLYVRRFHDRAGDVSVSDRLDRRQAGLIAELAIAHPTATIHPRGGDEAGVPAMRRRLAEAARTELAARKRRLALMSYDDLLTRLRDTLAGPTGPQAAARLRERYRYVLIDEFQDTDPVQWEIVARAFAGPDTTLVLIADPKQAIYAFRGADVYAYLEAIRRADRSATLTVNHRSDQRLLDGLAALFGDARLGHREIVHRHVQAAPGNRATRLHGAPDSPALRIRIVDRTTRGISITPAGFASAPSVRAHVAREVAAEVVALLQSGATIEQRSPDREGGTRCTCEPLAPGDVAVLVPTHARAAEVHRALDAAGVPAVLGGAGSVFATGTAGDWLALLEALERPASPARARAAALTALIGSTAAELAGASEQELGALHRRLFAWARILRGGGVAALAEEVTRATRMPERLLARHDGERQLTDLQHVAELLHGAATVDGLGVAALAGWLRQRIALAPRERGNDELTRRLESDAAAVQVLTIHRAKGLEFPIVLCPFLWDLGWISDEQLPVAFHDEDADGRRAVDVGLEGADYRAHREQYIREERGEDLRLMYVALTRARHQAVLWWAGSFGSRDSALGRLVFARDGDGNVAWRGRSVPSDEAAFARFSELAATADGAVSVEWSRERSAARFAAQPRAIGELSLAVFQRGLDRLWRRTSYTAITAVAHEALVASEPEDRGVADEPDVTVVAGAGELPLAALAGGARVGTIVHRALEAVDFTAAELEPALTAALVEAASPGAAELGCAAGLAGAGLALALATPLGGSLGTRSLRDVRRADRLSELEFELPVAGGEQPAGCVSAGQFAALLDAFLPAGDPLAGYAERLRDPALAGAFRGYLTGTIDLVVRVPGGGTTLARPRFAIVDYKTNWLAPAGEPLTAWHYRRDALVAEMARSHYALQALLYAVALHRYLRWRVPGYEPASDLCGVYYLFLRGMVGDGAGVFAWQPPAALVIALSDLLDRAQSG